MDGEGEADGGAAGAAPLSLAALEASNGIGREGGASTAEGGPRGRPGGVAGLQQQQQQRRVIRWERFLPRRSLRVLLVEQDDSTRHIVTALLRKCNYRVASAANGLKAWGVLKEKNFNFDLVLSEVEVPTLSGISLLCKIMVNELSKNIPVIMMSSHDSVSVVFRCMQKGAVDFLVKPVRKNELRNLWQHVWRRHCSTSFGNGPENMPNNQTVSESMSDNHAASNDVSAHAGKGSRTGESCDGDDDQSSGSKPMMQNESSKKQGAHLLVGDRNSASVIKAQSQQLCDNAATFRRAPKMDDDDKPKNKLVGVEVAPSVQEITTLEKVQEQIHFHDRPLCKGKDFGFARPKECVDADLRPFWQNAMPYKPPEGTIGFIASVANGQHSFSLIDNDSEGEKALCKTKRSSDLINICAADASASWELSLMKPQLNGSVKIGFQEKNILNHSATSAFSRYAHTGICLPGQKSGSSSTTVYIRNRESAEKCNLQVNSQHTTNERSASFIPDGRLESSWRNKGDMVYHQISSCNDEDAEPPVSVPSGEDICIDYSAIKDTVAFPQSKLGMMPWPIHVGAIPFQSFCTGHGPILQPMFYHEPSVPPGSSTVIVRPKCLTISDQPADHGNQMVADVQSTAFHNCEENCPPCHLELRKKVNPVDTEQSDPRKPRLNTDCGMEQNDQCGSCSQDVVNGSGSNGSGGTADAAVNTKTSFDHRNERELHHYTEKGMDYHLSHREAALIKFRLKRKDRCFEKKVRYHSRKMLAEQRPRVKGQFVRQAIVDSNMSATEVDD